MNISIEQVQKIFKTLPIGYYIGRNIDASLEMTETSYYNFIQDKVVVSYLNIIDMVKKIKNPDNLEKAIRGCLYHELSHVLLTPFKVYKDIQFEESLCAECREIAKNHKKYRDIFNIFEDERIETILKNYYIDVNFKENVFLVNQITKEEAEKFTCKDELQYFYNIVRFDVGPKDLILEKYNIIKKYSYINSTDKFDWTDIHLHLVKKSQTNRYLLDILEFYDKCVASFNQTTEKNNKENEENEENKNMNNIDKDIDKDIKEIMENIDSDLNIIFTNFNIDHQNIKALFDGKEIYTRMKKVLDQAKTRKSIFGGSHKTYSGHLDPRQVSKLDYKWWNQKFTEGEKKYDKIRMNFIIDNSGSMVNNTIIINKFLNALYKFKKDTNNFEFNIMFQSDHPIIINNNNPIIYKANGYHSVFKNDFKQAYVKLQTPKCYNLIVLDGEFNDKCDAFELFNKSNTFIISDLDNRDKINQKSYKAHKILVDKDYANVFIDNVVKAINTLLR